MTYTPPRHGFRTFLIVWAAQSLSVIGSMTGFALNVYLAQVLYPAPEQKAELALAFTALNLGFTIPFVFGGPLVGVLAAAAAAFHYAAFDASYAMLVPDRLIAWTILPLSTAAGGALAGPLDPGYVLASLGLIWAVFSAAQLFNPYLLRIEVKSPTDVSLAKEARPPT
jgi:hypothetical protein